MTTEGRSAIAYVTNVLLIGLGVWLIITGVQFAGFSDTATSSTKAANAATGALVGAGVGFGTYLIIGGVGVATGGVGFALGAAALTALGVGAGALTGAATGKTIIVLYDYPTWLWGIFLLLGCLAFYVTYASLKRFIGSSTPASPSPVNTVDNTSLPARLKLKARIALVIVLGAALGIYVSTKTKRAPPPTPALENIVFKDQGIVTRTMERVRWNFRKTQIYSKWDGYYLQADEMVFRANDGKWVEQ